MVFMGVSKALVKCSVLSCKLLPLCTITFLMCLLPIEWHTELSVICKINVSKCTTMSTTESKTMMWKIRSNHYLTEDHHVFYSTWILYLSNIFLKESRKAWYYQRVQVQENIVINIFHSLNCSLKTIESFWVTLTI